MAAIDTYIKVWNFVMMLSIVPNGNFYFEQN